MLKRLLLKLANKILADMGGQAEIDDVCLVRMSKEFHDWTYSKGYKMFEESQRK